MIEGLLLSDMYQTARGMIDNFLYMVKKYGFIPNGGRIYYLMRSQPPLIHLMVRFRPFTSISNPSFIFLAVCRNVCIPEHAKRVRFEATNVFFLARPLLNGPSTELEQIFFEIFARICDLTLIHSEFP